MWAGKDDLPSNLQCYTTVHTGHEKPYPACFLATGTKTTNCLGTTLQVQAKAARFQGMLHEGWQASLSQSHLDNLFTTTNLEELCLAAHGMRAAAGLHHSQGINT
jgi:hypothetical protein